MTNSPDSLPICQKCEIKTARRYELTGFDSTGESSTEKFLLCVGCARTKRKRLWAEPETETGLTRKELIAELDRFFAASGVFDICARCHQQGTGCCPPTCRVMGVAGCDPNNKRGKTVFCATFICSALLNAISECDPELGRTLRRLKSEVGSAEFHIYEMITRVPAEAREPYRPLVLPNRYPQPPKLNGESIKKKLLALTDEVLELRRIWREQEQSENTAALFKAGQSK
ncbi:MAG: hypothetical protein SF097_13815 [Acidobacteriota bacterium]|nr:hypothetical protein [Acidobacteriota bacterium]